MKRMGWVLAAVGVSLLCGATLAGAARAASCHESVAGAAYACTSSDGNGVGKFGFLFDPTGDSLSALSADLRCFCSSTGGHVAGLEAEAGPRITCARPAVGDFGFALSARVAGRKLTQGTIATLFTNGDVKSVFFVCERVD
jgi:hypothetical protein